MGTPKIRHEFADRLRHLRRKYNLTQAQVAERAGLGARYYQRIESRKPTAVKIDTIAKIAKALGVPSWKLLKPLD